MSVVLTPEEQRQFGPLFKQYDTEGTQVVLGEQVRPLLERSGLTQPQLGQIWQIADAENRGFLDHDGFAKSMRMIYHVQHGQPLSAKLANIPAGVPKFEALPAQAQAQAPQGSTQAGVQAPVQPPVSTHGAPLTGQYSGQPPFSGQFTGSQTATSPQISANGEAHIPPLTAADKQRYGQIFDRSRASDGLISGEAARDIFLKARLPSETLARIWALIDVQGRGRLTKNEFVVAMHLIQSTITKSLPSVPAALPAQWLPWLGTTPQRQGSITTLPSVSQLQIHHSGSSAGGASSPTSPATANSMQINPQERAQFNAIFDSLDKQHTGIIGANEAVPVLTKSGLSEEVLAKVWDLADTRSRGVLDRGEFAIAMHIVKAKLNGYELPETIPQHLLQGASAEANNNGAPPPPQVRRTGTILQTSQQANQNPQSHAGQASASHRSQQPEQAQQQAKQSTGADLLQLDDTFFKPKPAPEPEPPKPEHTSSQTFQPSSSFGQQLLNRSTTLQGSNPAQPGAHPGVQQAGHQSATPPSSQKELTQTQKSVSDLQQQNQTLLENQASIGKESKAVEQELAQLQKSKRLLEVQVAELRKTYDGEAVRVHQTKQQIDAVKAEIAQLEKDVKLRQGGLTALQEQNEQHKKELDTVVAAKVELESQHAAHQKTVDDLNGESQRYLQEIDASRQLTNQHEATLQDLLVQAEAARARRDEHKRIAEEANRRVQEATASRAHAEREHAEALQQAQDAERERGLAESAANKERLQAAEQHVRLQTATPTSGQALQSNSAIPTPGVTSAATVAAAALGVGAGGAAAAIVPRSDSIASIGTNASAGAETATPRTSPPLSEGGALPAAPIAAPTFELPMHQPQSPATSSVANNAPLSVRGEFDESEPQSPAENLGDDILHAPQQPDSGRDSDSFEFVDARDAQEQPSTPTAGSTAVAFELPPPPPQPVQPSPERTFEDSSDDEAGPEAPIPTRYVQTGQSGQPSASGDATGSGIERFVTAKDGEPSHVLSSAMQPDAQLTQGSIRPPAATAVETPQKADEFGDEFDDLEEAATEEPVPGSVQSTPVQSAGPDEWQQLFAGTRSATSGTPEVHEKPDTAPGHAHYKEAVQQLASMGFSPEEANEALERTGYDMTEATNLLLDKL